MTGGDYNRRLITRGPSFEKPDCLFRQAGKSSVLPIGGGVVGLDRPNRKLHVD